MKFLSISLLAILLFVHPALAQTKTEKEVAATAEHFRQALINPDSAALSKLVTDDLTYGHSSGKIEDKKTFMNTLLTGQSDFVTIDLTDQTIIVHGKTAIVRHILSASTNDNNKPGTVKLAVLTVWVKEHHQWRLLARQAVRPAQ